MTLFHHLQMIALHSLLVIVLWNCLAGADVCEPLTPGSDDPSLPSLNISAFVTTYRVTIVDKGYSMWARESYDAAENFIRVDTLQDGVQSSFLLDFGVGNEGFIQLSSSTSDGSGSGWTCSCEAFSADELTKFGFHQSADGTYKIMSAADAIEAAQDAGYKYVDQVEFEGIQVDHWQSCQIWDDIGATFMMDFFSTTSDFTAVDDLTPSQIPVKIEITGEVTDPSTGATSDLHHVYEYLDFHAVSKLPGETYSLPDYVTCSGPRSGRWARSVPDLPTSMSYTLEKVVTTPAADGASIVQVDTRAVYHDTKRKLVRVDNPKGTYISDFNTGVEFVLDGSGCSTRAIDPGNVDSAYLDSDGFIKMQNNPEIEYLSKYEHEFTGNKPFREIAAVGFSSESTTEGVETFYTDDEDSVPLGVRIKDYTGGVTTQYNIFGFVNFTEGFDKDPFVIKGCEVSNNAVVMTLYNLESDKYGFDSEKLASVMPEIIVGLRDSTASLAETSILQIYPTDYLATDNELYWYFSLLEIDLETPTGNVENKVDLISTGDLYSVIMDAVYEGDLVYSYGEPDPYVFIGTSIVSDSDAISSEDPLSSFSRSEDRCVADPIVLEPSVSSFEQSASDCAQACLDLIDGVCKSFQYAEDTKSCLISTLATTTPELTDQPGCDFYMIHAIGEFIGVIGTVMVGDDEVRSITVADDEECARACLEETTFKCESIDVCCDDSSVNCTCSLHKTHYYSEQAEKDSSEEYDECKHFYRDYSDDYVFQGYITIDFPDAQPFEVNHISECYYLCSDGGGQGCSMFSYCYEDVDGVTSRVCTFVAPSQETQVQQASDDNCKLYTMLGETGSSSLASTSGGEQTSSGYTNNQMAGLAFGMVITGIVVGVISVFMLSKFGIWSGFHPR